MPRPHRRPSGVSLRAYARLRGVSPEAVSKALRAGRISANGDGRIDPERADRDWEANTRPHMNGNGNATGYQTARTAREALSARLLEMKYRERAAELVEVSAVQAAAKRAHAMVRRVVLRIPDRLTDALQATGGNQAKVHRLLTAEARRMLDELAGG